MSDIEKNSALTPKETEQAVSDLAERLADMDRAEGVFGEPVDEDLPDEYMDEIAGGITGLMTAGAIRWRYSSSEVVRQ